VVRRGGHRRDCKRYSYSGRNGDSEIGECDSECQKLVISPVHYDYAETVPTSRSRNSTLLRLFVGYRDAISYEIRDQLGAIVPSAVDWNE